MSWDSYTIFSVISGVVLVLTGLAATRLRARDRVWAVIGGLAIGGYGIYVAAQTTGTYTFPVAIFIIPFALVGYLVFAARAAAADGTEPPSANAARSMPPPLPVPGKVRVPEQSVVGEHGTTEQVR